MKNVSIAILGLGTVGGGTYEIIAANGAAIAKNHGVQINVKWVLERDMSKAHMLPSGVLTTDFEQILSDPEVSIVVELIGGTGVAKDFVLRALAAGKTVVTANKEMLAKHGAELELEAKKNGTGLYYEASCMGGVPVVRTLQDSMQANRVLEFKGIFNGTTNYILTKMANEGMEYSEALSEAQRLGFAEQDPTSDVEGFDTAYKLSILAGMSFHTPVPFNRIVRKGITQVTALDLAAARQLGCAVKLLAVAKREGKEVSARVFPAFVPLDHPLAGVNDAFNAVFFVGDFVGEIMLYGKGAGAFPTGSAVVSDIVVAASTKKHRYSTYKNSGEAERGIKLNGSYRSCFYLRLLAEDKAGTVAKISAVLGAHRISIAKMYQDEACEGESFARIVFLTHETDERDMLRAIERLKTLECVGGVESLIHVVK